MSGRQIILDKNFIAGKSKICNKVKKKVWYAYGGKQGDRRGKKMDLSENQ